MNKSIKWVEITEAISLGVGALRAHKFRSAMTIVGVMIGVCAVILVNTIMDGFSAYAESSIDKIGTNVMYIVKYDHDTDWNNMTEEERTRKDITMDEALAVQQYCSLVKAVAPQKSHFDNIAKYGRKSARNPDDFRGTWPTFSTVMNRGVEFGRFLDDNDMRRNARVCVIGPEISDALFADRAEAVGKEIRVNSQKFTVIGVQEEIKDLFEISENDYILIPMTTFDDLYPNVKEVELLASAVSRERFTEAYDEVVNALRRVRRVAPTAKNNFGILTQERFKEMIGGVTTTVQLGAVAVAAVGLMVGLIGVMNIMLVSVTERTREIGIRKAIGARKRNILMQFLVEAATLTGLGGITGLVLGALVGLLVTTLLDWAYFLSPLWIMIGLVMSIGTGLAAGMYPAWKAARLDPIEALRYE